MSDTESIQIDLSLVSENTDGKLSAFHRTLSSADLEALKPTEEELEKDLTRESKAPPKGTLARFRHDGEQILHSKHVLMAVVILNVLDCLLVMGELIFDINYIVDVLQKTDQISDDFVLKMYQKYPHEMQYITDYPQLYDKLLRSTIVWENNNDTSGGECSNCVCDQINGRRRRDVTSRNHSINLFLDISKISRDRHPTEEKIAHGFHKASITILAILVVETSFKIFCQGKHMLERKLEIFDSIVVYTSFTLDLVFIKGITIYSIEEFVDVLAFLVIWRIIRVVNSLIVAIMDHEHFRMKLLYIQKKQISSKSKILKKQLKLCQKTNVLLREMCLLRGISESELNESLELGETKPKKKKLFGMSPTASPILSRASPILSRLRSYSNPVGVQKPNKSEKTQNLKMEDDDNVFTDGTDMKKRAKNGLCIEDPDIKNKTKTIFGSNERISPKLFGPGLRHFKSTSDAMESSPKMLRQVQEKNLKNEAYDNRGFDHTGEGKHVPKKIFGPSPPRVPLALRSLSSPDESPIQAPFLNPQTLLKGYDDPLMKNLRTLSGIKLNESIDGKKGSFKDLISSKENLDGSKNIEKASSSDVNNAKNSQDLHEKKDTLNSQNSSEESLDSDSSTPREKLNYILGSSDVKKEIFESESKNDKKDLNNTNEDIQIAEKKTTSTDLSNGTKDKKSLEIVSNISTSNIDCSNKSMELDNSTTSDVNLTLEKSKSLNENIIVGSIQDSKDKIVQKNIENLENKQKQDMVNGVENREKVRWSMNSDESDDIDV